MSRQGVTIDLDRDPPDYLPDESLSGGWSLPAGLDRDVRAVELSVMWTTEGKGDEDIGVHHFERVTPEEAGMLEPGRRTRFSARLPRSPLSYDGVIVKVCWCVRARAFWDGGETVAEAPFWLGEVARAREVQE
jgi:hypothetical protein